MRRQGSFRDHDFNDRLIEPFMQSIASTWDRVFARNNLDDLERQVNDTVDSVLCQIKNSVTSQSSQHKISHRANGTSAEIQASLSLLLAEGHAFIDARQRDVSRSLAPHVQEKLEEGYKVAGAESGQGCWGRSKVSSTVVIPHRVIQMDGVVLRQLCRRSFQM